MAKPSPYAHHPELLAFGEALRARRKALGISQEELAAKAGLDRSYVGGVERGEHNLSLLTAGKLWSATGSSSFFGKF